MIAYRFGPEDLGRVRFAISPLFEIAASLDVLRDPARHAMHAPWVATARERLAGLDLALLEAVVPAPAYRPDFVHPPPRAPAARLRLGARARAGDPARAGRPRPRLGLRGRAAARRRARRCSTTRPRGMAELTELMTAYWRRAIEPHWPAIRATLEADIAYRAGRLAEGGPLAAFADLHEEVALARRRAARRPPVRVDGRARRPRAAARPRRVRLAAAVGDDRPALAAGGRLRRRAASRTLWEPAEQAPGRARRPARPPPRRDPRRAPRRPPTSSRAATPPAPPASPSTSPSSAAPA